MAEYDLKWQHPSTLNVLKPNQKMLGMPLTGTIYNITLTAKTRRIRVRMYEGLTALPFDISYDPLMTNYETIPATQFFQEGEIYNLDTRTIYLRCVVGPATAHITYWDE